MAGLVRVECMSCVCSGVVARSVFVEFNQGFFFLPAFMRNSDLPGSDESLSIRHAPYHSFKWWKNFNANSRTLVHFHGTVLFRLYIHLAVELYTIRLRSRLKLHSKPASTRRRPKRLRPSQCSYPQQVKVAGPGLV